MTKIRDKSLKGNKKIKKNRKAPRVRPDWTFWRERREELQSYINYLNRIEWNYWCTGTTPYQLTIRSSRRLISAYMDKLSTDISYLIFWCAEPFDVKDGYHLHFLLKVEPDTIRYKEYYQKWQVVTAMKKYKGTAKWARITMERYNPEIGAGGYVTKYITKQGADYDILESGWNGYSLDKIPPAPKIKQNFLIGNVLKQRKLWI